MHLWEAQGVGCGGLRHPPHGLLVTGGLERVAGKPSVTACPAHSSGPVSRQQLSTPVALGTWL